MENIDFIRVGKAYDATEIIIEELGKQLPKVESKQDCIDFYNNNTLFREKVDELVDKLTKIFLK